MYHFLEKGKNISKIIFPLFLICLTVSAVTEVKKLLVTINPGPNNESRVAGFHLLSISASFCSALPRRTT
jgi:hypothetical protein